MAEIRSGKEGARSSGFGAYAAQPAIKSAEVTHAYRCGVLGRLKEHRETGIIDCFPTSRPAAILTGQNSKAADARITAR